MTDDGTTDIAFAFDGDGNFYGLKVIYTNAEWNQPFFMANVSIRVLGNLIISNYRDNMTEEDRKLVQKLVNDADAKSLLELSLRIEQALGT